jgi:hypothetical protein
MLAVLDMVNYIFDPDYYKHNSKVSLICEAVNGRRTDNTMTKRKKTDNTMAKRKKTDNTMVKRKKTDNTHCIVCPFFF